MLTFDLRNILYWTIYLCVDTPKGHINAENWVKEHIHFVRGIDRRMWNRSTYKCILDPTHTQKPVTVATLKQDITPDVFVQFSYQLSIRSEYGLYMILRKGCLDTTRLWRDVDVCNGLVSELAHFVGFSCLPRQKIGWIPQGTGWNCHSIWTWTSGSNSGDQLQQTRQNPAGWKFPRNSASHALFLWGWWAPRIAAGSHPMPQGCGAWAAAPYSRCACRRTKSYSHHHHHPVQTCSAGTQEPRSWARGSAWWVFSTPSPPAHSKNHQDASRREPTGISTVHICGASCTAMFKKSDASCAWQHQCMTCRCSICHESILHYYFYFWAHTFTGELKSHSTSGTFCAKKIELHCQMIHWWPHVLLFDTVQVDNAIHVYVVKVEQCNPVDGVRCLGFLVIHQP